MFYLICMFMSSHSWCRDSGLSTHSSARPSLRTSLCLSHHLLWRTHLHQRPSWGPNSGDGFNHTTWSSQTHFIIQSRPFMFSYVTLWPNKMKNANKGKQKNDCLWFQRRPWEPAVCNCLATAGTASVQVQRPAVRLPRSSRTHQRCKVKGCLRLHVLTNTHMSTHNPLCQFNLAMLLTQKKI